MTNRNYTWRMLLVVVVLALVWVGLGTRLAYLHLGPNERLRTRIADIRKVEQQILVGRGRVLERFTQARVAVETYRVYQEVLADGSGA